MVPSLELRAMIRPFVTHRALAHAQPPPGWGTLLRRPLLCLLMLGAFVSFTAAGRLVAVHLLSTLVFWAFAPAAQGLAAVVATRALAPRRLRPSQAVDLVLAGNGPWYLLLLFVSGVVLFAPDVLAAAEALVRSRALVALFAGVAAWGALLTWACFRHGLALPRWRAAAATALYYACFFGVLVSWLLAAVQLQPLFRTVA